jgi:CHAT domain-containing protein/tetratricopeptide (TPR) repeat protein
MSTLHLLNSSDDQLKTLATTAPPERLDELFTGIWQEIRGARHLPGQPRNAASSQSLALANIALQLATHSGREKLLVEAWHMMAHSLMADEQYEQAIPYYERRIQYLDRKPEPQNAARARQGYVLALLHAGKYEEALAVGSAAEKWFRENGDNLNFARICTNIGNVFHRLDDHVKAYRYYSMASEVFTKLDDQGALAQVCLNLGNALSNLDRFDESDKMYQRSEQLSEALGMVELHAQASYNRAFLSYLRGRYSDALQSFSGLRDRFEKSGSTRHYALCDLDEAEIYLQLNLPKDAATLALRASQQFERIGFRYEQAKAMAFHGVALIQLHRLAEALETFRTSQEIFQHEGNAYWIGLVDLYRAEVHLSTRRFWEAQVLATNAKKTFENLAIPSKRIFSLVLLGRVAMALDDLMAAEHSAQEIADIIKDVKMPLVLFPYHLLCAEIAERGRQWDEARAHYESAAQELERHQARLHHDDLRVTFFKGRYKAYDALVRLSLDEGADEVASPQALASAYSWCERARSRGLVELLSHYSPAGRGHVQQSLLLKINRLREELNIQYARWQPELTPLPAVSNFETITMKEQELARALRDVSRDDPEYASLQQVSIATLDSLQCALPERTTVVEYFTTGDEVLAFIVSRHDARVIRRICPARRVLAQQERLAFQLDKFQLGKDYVSAHSGQILETTNRHLRELYRNLVEPFINDIKTPHLAIVPHGSLHFLPFHAFFSGDRYLIDSYEISYAPSASVLKYCLEKEVVVGSSPLLVGVADERVPLVKEELKRLKGLFPDARILQDESATRDAFVDSSKASHFLHVATHAVFRQDNPMFSSFRLADGWFTAFDLFSMLCRTNLVTLSGCQSGMSEVTGADDLLGLMRGFLYAGARSLLLSLWNVNDESTTALMTDFYWRWHEGTTKSAALRSAMLSVREQFPNPFYWAPFLLVGNP